MYWKYTVVPGDCNSFFLDVCVMRIMIEKYFLTRHKTGSQRAVAMLGRLLCIYDCMKFYCLIGRG